MVSLLENILIQIDLKSSAVGLVVPSSYLFNITVPVPKSIAYDVTLLYNLGLKCVSDKSDVRDFSFFPTHLAFLCRHPFSVFL